MELYLLDQLLGSDEPLGLAALVFDIENHPGNLERARHAIFMQVKEGLLQIVSRSDPQERVLEDWEIRQVLSDIENWLRPHAEARYFLRITDKGANLV